MQDLFVGVFEALCKCCCEYLGLILGQKPVGLVFGIIYRARQGLISSLNLHN